MNRIAVVAAAFVLSMSMAQARAQAGTASAAAAPTTFITVNGDGGARVYDGVGRKVASLSDSTLKRGIPGIEVGGWYPAYFSNLSVTAP